jgi:hypothetical protein
MTSGAAPSWGSLPCNPASVNQFRLPPGEIICRTAAETLATRDRTALLQAYARWAKVPPGHPASLWGQAVVHGYYCGGFFGILNAGFDIHADFQLFLWHRWFVYFHERALQRWAPGLRVPYWRNSYQPLTVAPLYEERPLQPMHPGSQFQVTSNNHWVAGNGPDQEAIVEALRRAPTIIGAKNVISPWHDWVHGQFRRLLRLSFLGSAATAAADPLFYAFHAQIDRYFQFWLNQEYEISDDLSGLRQRYVFFDAGASKSGAWVWVRAGDALQLRHAYEDLPGQRQLSQRDRILVNLPPTMVARSRTGAYQIILFFPGYTELLGTAFSFGRHHAGSDRVEIRGIYALSAKGAGFLRRRQYPRAEIRILNTAAGSQRVKLSLAPANFFPAGPAPTL